MEYTSYIKVGWSCMWILVSANLFLHSFGFFQLVLLWVMALNWSVRMKGELKMVYKVAIVACCKVHHISKFTWERPVTVYEYQRWETGMPNSTGRSSRVQRVKIVWTEISWYSVCVCVFPAWRSPHHQQQFVRIIAVNMHTQPLCTSKSCYHHHYHCSTVYTSLLERHNC